MIENCNHPLPKLPDSLLEFWYCNSDITILPPLPKRLNVLCCWGNRLTSLPSLPDSLQKLSCPYNHLISLFPLDSKEDKLPENLDTLFIQHNFLSSIPKIPESVNFFRYNDNPFLYFPEDIPKFSIESNVNIIPLICRLQRKIREKFRKRREKVLPFNDDLNKLIASYL